MTHSRRLLRLNEQVARVLHRCDQCDGSIFPGDLYEVRVELFMDSSYKYLHVYKSHIHPACQFDPDDGYYEECSTIILFKLAA
jgi:hypothetical protein